MYNQIKLNTGMTYHLPCGDFEDLCSAMCREVKKEFQTTCGVNFRLDSEFGLLIECDLLCPDEATARLLDIFPPCVEAKEVEESQLSPYMLKLKQDKKLEMSGKRLVMDLLPKKHILINSFALRCYLRAGIKLMEVHSVICYHQEPILKKHVNHLSTLRNSFDAKGLVSNAQACKKLANSVSAPIVYLRLCVHET